MAQSRSVAARHVVISRIFARLPMSAWLSFSLLTGSWTRPIGQTATVWALSLPGFLLLEVLRWKLLPDRNAYLGWLDQAVTAARDGRPRPLPMPGRTRRLILCYGPLMLVVTYLAAFLFVPSARLPAPTLDGVPVVEWVYSIVGAWYPTYAREPAHVLALGHAQDASDLRHFMAVALLLSLGWAFVASGPGRPELVGRWLLLRTPFRIALGEILVGGLLLAMFAVFGEEDSQSGAYLHLQAFVPCAMFTLGGLPDGVGYRRCRSPVGCSRRYLHCSGSQSRLN